LVIVPGYTNYFSTSTRWKERILYGNQPSLISISLCTNLADPPFLWCKSSNIALPSLQHEMGGGGTIFPPLALLKKARAFDVLVAF
jgi:hypothetical protein